MCATSPPFWRLRDYNVEGQLGMEATPEEYVERLVGIFAEVRRVLKPRSVVFLNLGDSYASGKGTCHNPGGGEESLGVAKRKEVGAYPLDRGNVSTLRESGVKPKDLVGIPWRVAFALQADGWWLRNDVVWAKPNPMPESVKDRFSTTYEHVFLLAKQKRYWFDLDAVREEHTTDRLPGNRQKDRESTLMTRRPTNRDALHPLGKNPGDVWRIVTQPTPYAHFATWPEALVERMLKAGCPPQVCSECGEPWEHRVEKRRILEHGRKQIGLGNTTEIPLTTHGQGATSLHHEITIRDLGYHPACRCQEHLPKSVPGTVLDPFVGSGTTTQVARKLG
ncbi:MAG: site-specific DNA-methyltransferase, partial [Candidatus Hydrogenedentes bacterium]|nr:site-specific DNA-methyltransferase [Candidatus Hydrogenedentota bacterium]